MKPLQNLNLTSKSVVDLFIYAHSADSSSILGIVLGNFGLNMNNFCTEFNNYTKDLPTYFLLKVRIVVFENRTFAFSISLANVGYYLKLLSFERDLQVSQRGRWVKITQNCLYFNDFFGVFRLKFPQWSVDHSFSLFFSVLNSCNLKLVLF